MAKAAWGKKHTCPKCAVRFYDLGKKGPVVCIECEHKWVPEPILKAKQTHAAPAKPVEPVAEKPADVVAAPERPEGAEGVEGKEDSDVAAIKGLEVEVEVEDEDDKKGASVLGDVSLDDESGELAGVVDTKLEQGGGE